MKKRYGKMRGSQSFPLFRDSKYGLRCALAGIAIALLRVQTLPHFAKSSHHRFSCLAIRDDSPQLGEDTLCREVCLYQLRHNISFGDQIDHREAVYPN